MVKTEKSAHISYNDETWHPSSKRPKNDATCHRRFKKYMNYMTQPLISADISIFQWKLANIALSRNADKDCILAHNFRFL